MSQAGNLTLHLETMRENIEKLVPTNFRGLGVLDFEKWTPLAEANENWSHWQYGNFSLELVRKQHPDWPEYALLALSRDELEQAGK